MPSRKLFKCRHCKELLPCEPRNRGRQHYCSKPECRKVSKAASQKRWASKPENQNYFRGTENSERVRRWRKANPGYWRKRKPPRQDALQDTCPPQISVGEALMPKMAPRTLQDLCSPQPSLIVGLIAVLTGHALQDDIAASARIFNSRGEDILRMGQGAFSNPDHENQTHSLCPSTQARASPV